MKKLLFLLITVIIFTSCGEEKMTGVIQEIVEPDYWEISSADETTRTTKDYSLYLKTIVSYEDKLIYVWLDGIDYRNNINDTIKCYRYNQAKVMLDRIIEFDKLKCD